MGSRGARVIFGPPGAKLVLVVCFTNVSKARICDEGIGLHIVVLCECESSPLNAKKDLAVAGLFFANAMVVL